MLRLSPRICHYFRTLHAEKLEQLQHKRISRFWSELQLASESATAVASTDPDINHAASVARHISGIVAVGPRMARKLDPPNPKANQGLHLRPKLWNLRVGECPGNSADQAGDAKIVDTAHTSGVPAVHD